MSEPNWIAYRDLPAQEQAQAVAYLRGIEWGAGRHLAALLAKDAFAAEYGDSAGLYLVRQDGDFIGFGALVDKDYLPRPALKPWIAFVYVDPKARGQRLSEKIVRYLENQAAAQGFGKTYLVSQHLGLYEKYGYTLLEKTDEGIHDVDYLYEKTLA